MTSYLSCKWSQSCVFLPWCLLRLSYLMATRFVLQQLWKLILLFLQSWYNANFYRKSYKKFGGMNSYVRCKWNQSCVFLPCCLLKLSYIMATRFVLQQIWVLMSVHLKTRWTIHTDAWHTVWWDKILRKRSISIITCATLVHIFMTTIKVIFCSNTLCVSWNLGANNTASANW